MVDQTLKLACPICKQHLSEVDDRQLKCAPCNAVFPVYDNVPILINDCDSVFLIADHVPKEHAIKPEKGLKATVLSFLTYLQRLPPSISLNAKAKENFSQFGQLLRTKQPNPRVLVIGGRTTGEGMEALNNMPIKFTAVDIVNGPNTDIICDAHHLPFEDGQFDGVVIQAVIEYLLYPERAVAEIHRVLSSDGLVYAETPFMQQVHGREFDYMRFTHLGHRHLFRHFEEIRSGACVGTGSAMAWSWKYFLLSLSDKGLVRELLLLFANWTAFPWKYFDHLTINNRGTLDAASGYFFLGRKSALPLGDAALIKQYRGMQ